MTTYVYNTFPAFVVLPFDASRDVLDFSSSNLSSFAQIVIGDDNNNGNNNNNDVTFLTSTQFIKLRIDDPQRFTDANFILPDGGKILIGDNAATVRDDDLANTLVGSSFSDMLAGLGGNDSISAGAGDDFIIMFSGNNDDVGADTIDGGTGFDVIDFRKLDHNGFPASLNVNLAAGSYSITSVTGFDLTGTPNSFSTVTGAIVTGTVEAVIGAHGNDTLTGDAAPNMLDGTKGNDSISGGAGNDTLFGGEGNDTILGGAGDDVMRGGFGIDSMDGGDGSDLYVYSIGEPINDTGTTGIDTQQTPRSGSIQTAGGIENLTLVGNIGPDSGQATFDAFFSGNFDGNNNPFFDIVPELIGNNLNNVITGNGRFNFFIGAAGNDTFIGGGGLDIVEYDSPISSIVPAGPSGITVTFTGGGTGSAVTADMGTDVFQGISGVVGSRFNDSISGGTGADDQILIGSGGNDTIVGGGGNDTLLGLQGNDSLVGDNTSSTIVGSTHDVVSYFDSETAVIVNLSATSIVGGGGTITVVGGTAYDGTDIDDNTATGFLGGVDTLSNIEDIAGGTFNDLLVGSVVDNRIWGGAGNDTIVPGEGNDSIDGGNGNFDWVYYNTKADGTAVTSALIINLAADTASGADIGSDTLSNVEFVRGGDGADTFTGGNPSLQPGIYFWSAPSEGFEGGKGADSVSGAAGDGWFTSLRYSNDNTNTLVGGSGGVSVNLGTGTATDGWGYTDTFVNIDGIWGSAGADTLTGGSNSKNFFGQLYEVFNGGAGSDVIDGAGGFDLVDYIGSPGAVAVNLSGNSILGGVASVSGGTALDGFGGVDTLSNIEWIRGSTFGGAGDTLVGNGGDNVFEGLQGNDAIVGGGGNDLVQYVRSFGGVTVNLSNTIVGANGSTLAGGTALDGFDSNSSTGGIQSYTDTLVSITGAIGSDFSDYFVGNPGGNNYFDGRGGVHESTLAFTDSDTVDYGQGGYTGPISLTGGTTATHFDSIGPHTDTLINIEAVYGAIQSDSLQGSDTSLQYTGLFTDRSERFRGNGGNDTIDGGNNAWGNNDTADYSNNPSANPIFVDLGSGTAQDGFLGVDTLINIDGVNGGAGDDLLQGGSNSRAFSGSFVETFRGGAGNDTIYGNDGYNVADYSLAGSSVNANLGSGNSFGSGGGTASDGQGGTDLLFNIDELRGGQSNDNLVGGGDNGNREVFRGNAGNDFIDGKDGLDLASYVSSPNAVYVDTGRGTALDGWGTTDNLANIEGAIGSDFNDTLIGGLNSNGDEGDWQVFEGRAGNDVIDGADGFVSGIPGVVDNGLDASEYRNAPSAVIVNMATGVAQDGYGTTDTLIGIEIAVGSRFGDTLIGGNAAHDHFEGFTGRAGNDSFVGGTGDDWLIYDEDQQGVVINMSASSIVVGANTILGGTALDGWDSDFNDSNGVQPGTDTFTGMEHVIGSEFNDLIVGSATGNFLHGNNGSDTLRGGGGDDTLDGGDPNSNGFVESTDTDFADYSTTANAVTVDLAAHLALAGADGNDVLTNINGVLGSVQSDTLLGSAGNDVFQGGAGNDSIDGGAGSDWVGYGNAASGVIVDLANQAASDGLGGTDSLNSIENVRGGDFDDSLSGSSGDNVFDPGLGDDTIISGVNSGFDTLTYKHASGGVSISLGLTSGTIIGAAGTDSLSGTVGEVDGSKFADTINSTVDPGLRQYIQGNGGADSITGDTSDGGLSILSFKDDNYFYNIDFSNYGGTNTVLQQDGSTLTFIGIDGVVGGQQNDSLTGGAGNDYFEGGDGSDSLVGGVGGADLASYRDAINPVVVNLGPTPFNLPNYVAADGNSFGSQTIASGSSFETNESNGNNFSNTWFDSISGIENLEGGAYNDTLIGGNTIANVLMGGAGNDQLQGGGGNAGDVYIGGSGFDQVNFNGTTSGLGVSVNLQLGTATRGGFLAGTDTLSGIEQIIGTSFDDTIVGAAQVYTGRFHDNVSALFGGAGGNDSIDGGSAANGEYASVTFSNTPLAVTASLATGTGGTGTSTITGARGIDTFVHIDELQGGSAADSLSGGSSSAGYSGQLFESFRGNAGNDTIDGAGGEDRVDYRFAAGPVTVTLGTGTANGSAVDGDGGTDTLINVENVRGSAFSDHLTGGGTQNAGTIYDYEVFEGMEGNDTINGGAGFDIASYSASDAGVVVNIGTTPLIAGLNTVQGGTALDGFGTKDTLTNIEQVVGSDYDDYLKGSDSLTDREAFRGAAGNDTIDGGAGNDAAYYNASPNAVVVNLATGVAQDGYGGTDTLINIEGARGSIYNDTLIGGAGNESFEGIQGDDSIDGGAGNDRIDYYRDQAAVTVTFTGAGTGTGTGSDTFSGSDTFTGIEAVRGTLLFNDTIIGNVGNETIEGAGGDDSIDGGAGNDVMSFRNATAAVNVTLVDSNVLQTLTTVAGTDSFIHIEGVQGTDFNDTLASGSGNDLLIGGLGNDSYVVNSTADAIVEAANEGTDTVTATIATGSYALTGAIENLILAGTASVGGIGNASNNLITGNAGNNTLDGGAGSDTMIGGAGNDTYFVDRGSDVITEASGTSGGIDTVILSVGFNPSAFVVPHGASADVEPTAITYTLSAFLENATVADPGLKINLTANASANFLVGGTFGDSINAAGGNDTLDGLGGLDTMVGGAGNDTYFVKQVGDTVDESIGGGAGIDTVISSIGFYGLTYGVENLTLATDPNPGTPTILIGRGNNLANYVKGNNDDNQLFGGDGNDTLEGGGGNDRLYGGAGSDSYVIDGGDTIIEVGGSAADNAKVKSSIDLHASVGIEGAAAVAGTYGIDITGNKQGNKIQGNETNNKLDGGAGGGADTLDGGLGNDTYVIHNTAIDKIIDSGGAGDAIQTDFSMSLVPFTTVENLLQVGGGDIAGVGNALANFMQGNSGSNLLSGMDGADDLQGGDGNDTLDGGKGADRLYGGAGNDTYILDDAGDQYFESARIEAVSVSAGAFGNAGSSTALQPATVISGDGRYIQFYSTASNLIAGDANNHGDTFVKDMLTGAVTRVSVGTTGTPVNTDVLHSSINPGGRFVAFTTTDSLATNDTNGVISDVYLRDWNPPTGTTPVITPSTKLLSVGINGQAGDGNSIMSDISSDGRFVAISSSADNLVAGDSNGFKDIFLVDRLANTLVRVSLSDDEQQSNGDSGNGVAISANGNFVAFASLASNLVVGDTNDSAPGGGVDIFLRDIAGQTTERISVDSNEVEADGASGNARISLDGRYVVFESVATNLVAGDTNDSAPGGGMDIFVRDRQAGTTTRVSTDSMGGEADGASTVGSISGDGRYVVFQSDADDLVTGDTNNATDVFVKDLTNGHIAMVSSGAGSSTAPDISEDGRYIVFTTGTAVSGADTNGVNDVVRIANPLIMGQGGIDTVKSPFSVTLTSEFENLVLLGTTATTGTGTNADNVLDGSQNTAANTLTGMGGNDTYIVGAGDVIIDSGGVDTVQSIITFSLAGLPDIENLTLTAKDTVLVNGTGNAAANDIKGNGAANVLDGQAGADTLEGGAGNDTYIADASDSIVELANGGANDTVKIDGASFDLTVSVYVENVVLLGTGSFNATGNGGNNQLTGNSGNNVLNGGLGNDTLVGGDGSDTYVVDNAKDVVTETGATGTDTVIAGYSYTLGTTLENLTLSGTDPLSGTGNASNNSITGNSGNNVLDGKAGNDTMAGGDGADIYYVDANGDQVIENGADGAIDEVRSAAPLFDGSGSNLLERIVLLGTAAIAAVGNALDNFMLGNSGANTLTGNLGNDTLDGGAGVDSLVGGDGNDLYFVDATGDAINDTMGTDSVISSAVAYTLAGGLDNLTLTGTAVTGTGSADANIITGNAGNNSLAGMGGADTLIGGLGNDTYNAENADSIVEFDGGGTDLVLGADGISIASWANVENLTLLSNGLAIGNGGNNYITGTALADTLDGGAGDDTLDGGAGGDTYVIDSAGDVIKDTVIGGAADTVVAKINYVLGATTLENLTLAAGAGDINGTGNAGGNVITGNDGNNYLSGGLGDDSLVGGAGNFDVADYAGTITAVNVNLGTGVVSGGAGADALGNDIEGVRGTSLADTLTGGDANDFVDYSNASTAVTVNLTGPTTVIGGAGADQISGFGGVRGSAFNDTMTGTSGDNFFFATANDSIDGAGGNDIIYSADGFSLANATLVENLTLVGTANVNAVGDGFDNIITGNAGDNYLAGGLGNDTLSGGGSGNDVADYFSATTGVIVDLTNHTAAGGAGNDSIGADIHGVRGSSSNDTLTGAGANDFVDYAGFAGPLTISLAEGTASGTSIGSDAISGFGGIRGGDGVDSLTGDGNNNFFYVTLNDNVTGGAGNDTIYSAVTYSLATSPDVEALFLTGSGAASATGNALDNLITGNSGNNTLDGGLGNDTLDGGAGNDNLTGGDGNDLYYVDAAGDVIAPDSGGTSDSVISSVNFTLIASLENLTLTGSGNLTGTGNAGNNSITGNDGNNTLDGGAGNDTLAGGAGNDTFIVDSSSDQASDSGGFDLVLASASFVLGSGIENLTLTGAANIDGTGNILDNVITGNAGNNALDGGAGNDTLVGGAGNDTYTVDSPYDVVTELAAGGTSDTLRAYFSTTLGATLENLVLLGGAGLAGTGNAANNAITGSTGNDTLSGGGGNDGNDTLDGGAGDDWLSGGGGNDFYVVDSVNDNLFEAVGAGTDTVQAKLNWTLADNFENLAFVGVGDWTGNGNAVANVITGSAGNDSIFGDAGADTLNGGLGNDTLDGGLGIDSMAGGDGNDSYFIDVATDKVAEAANQGIDTLVTPFTTVLPLNFENLTLTGSAAVNGTGTADANLLTGNNAANQLLGMAGNDTLIGAGGNDTLDGGTGDDSMAGGLGDDRFVFDSAGDTASEAFGEGNDTVVNNAVEGYTLQANLENLTLGGAILSGTGNGLDNLITGNASNNTLDGGAGNDTLVGGAGSDLLLGGNGNDVLVWDVNDAPLDGGAGDDTVKLAGAAQTLNLGTLGLGTVNAKLQSIERIDIGGTGNNNTLTFDFDQVRDLSADSNTLYVDGDLFDVVNSLHPSTVDGAPHWELQGVQPVGNVYYIEYLYQPDNNPDNFLHLFVNQDLTQNIS